jgi:hypothetical protein
MGPSGCPNAAGSALARCLAADEYLEFEAEREVGREGVVDDGVHEYRVDAKKGSRTLSA